MLEEYLGDQTDKYKCFSTLLESVKNKKRKRTILTDYLNVNFIFHLFLILEPKGIV